MSPCHDSTSRVSGSSRRVSNSTSRISVSTRRVNGRGVDTTADTTTRPNGLWFSSSSRRADFHREVESSTFGVLQNV